MMHPDEHSRFLFEQVNQDEEACERPEREDAKYRRRGMELAPRKELTREMVREIVKVALHESRAVVEYDDFLPGSPVGPAREADDFVARLYCRLTEALQ